MNLSARTGLNELANLIAVARALFDQGKHEQLRAALLQFPVEHTFAQYTSPKTIVQRYRRGSRRKVGAASELFLGLIGRREVWRPRRYRGISGTNTPASSGFLPNVWARPCE